MEPVPAEAVVSYTTAHRPLPVAGQTYTRSVLVNKELSQESERR